MQSGSHIVSLSLGNVAEPSGLVVVDPRINLLEPNDNDGKKRSAALASEPRIPRACLSKARTPAAPPRTTVGV